MDREQKERKKLQNHFKDLKSYVDKDTADLVNEVQKRDEVKFLFLINQRVSAQCVSQGIKMR